MVNLLSNTKTDKVLIAQKMQHKGALFGHISNGGGIISISKDYAIRFIANNDKFVTIELYRYAIDSVPQAQSWQKVKTVKEKIQEEEVKFNIKKEQKELF